MRKCVTPLFISANLTTIAWVSSLPTTCSGELEADKDYFRYVATRKSLWEMFQNDICTYLHGKNSSCKASPENTFYLPPQSTYVLCTEHFSFSNYFPIS